MSLPGGQRRALNQIEKTLADDDPGLGPLFAIFARLVGHEAMPVTERVTARPWWRQRRMRPAAVTVVGLAMAAVALFTLSLTLPSAQVCAPGTVTAGAARMQPLPAGRQPACVIQQGKPGETSQSGPGPTGTEQR
ncbi:MAG: hypothetical protein JWM19_2055 [Actinomycetia bacterium]|nr:hypothetical protein [Actinomycetes bacterium]